jgi:hypothetical protein
MTPEQKRLAIAKACRWTSLRGNSDYNPCYEWATLGGLILECPLTDLNAMHEAELTLSNTSPGKDKDGNALPSDRARYRLILSILCMNVGGPIHASAEQRAEAFLKTLGLYE